MSSASRQLLRLFRSVPLPSLKQGGTLSIRSSHPLVNVFLQPEWRDDGHVTLSQQHQKGEADFVIRKEDDKMTSLGRSESHVSIEVETRKREPVPRSATSKKWDFVVENTPSRPASSERKIMLDDGSIVSSVDLREEEERIAYSDGVDHIKKQDDGVLPPRCNLEIKVPEKVNIDCQLTQGGSITVTSKIEGDVKLFTSNGSIQVNKLRGHDLDLKASDTIFASDLLESQTLHVTTPGRLRAKRIHGSMVQIQVDHNSDAVCTPTGDNDDEGSLVDVSSIYTSGDAVIRVSTNQLERRAVRVKSHHGHLQVDTVSPSPQMKDDRTGQVFPIIELGGVNGSCDVTSRYSGEDAVDDAVTACQAHFDSVSPDSISLIRATHGKIALTVDRKAEADLRLVSAKDMDLELAMGLADDEVEVLEKTLNQLSASAKSAPLSPAISIKTGAFTEKPSTRSRTNVEYVDGCVENKSLEPDSRFDLAVKGGGKIRLEGAAAQALNGFDKEKASVQSVAKPLIVAATSGKIGLETLSWMGAIARRYGMEEANKPEAGRTASRKGRSLSPKKE